MIFSDEKMCAGSFHHGPINGLVDPLSFSAINFLRTYNRLLAPNELSQCYNLTLLKEPRPNRGIPLPLPPLPLQSILTNQIPPSESQQHPVLRYDEHPTIQIKSPTIRGTVSSTCPSSTTPDPNETTPKSTSQPSHPQPQHHSQFPSLSILEQNHNIDSNSLSPSFLRRQRGEKRPIPDEQKDEKYYERRKRNNEAAKKSRDARKMREDRVAFRAAILEQENAILRAQLIALRDEINTLRQLLCSRT